MLNRSNGILLPLFSLPSNDGIGTMGRSAYQFVDFLSEANVKYWQVLPLGVTSFGDSPYSCLSTFAGGYNYIDLDALVDMGLLECQDLVTNANPNIVDYEALTNKRQILKKAFKRFNQNDERFINFRINNQAWLEDFALFMSIKEIYNEEAFNWWPLGLKMHDKQAIADFANQNQDLITFYAFTQFIFFEQWMRLKAYANSKGIKIIGDLPIYVAYDSADVWQHYELFELDDLRVPKRVAGVPPDYFSKTGQLWGNPLYDYKKMADDNYAWWIKRLEHAKQMFDVIRLDHFRGFAGYYAIKNGAKDATKGVWQKGPGFALFKAIKKAIPDIELIAEDLGFLTKDVYRLLDRTCLPGMKIIQFGFGGDDSDHLPHNYKQNMIAYSGTHDNETILGWYQSLPKTSKALVDNYLNVSDDINDAVIRSLYASCANLVIIPLQDWLNLDNTARINTPSVAKGNWCWRLKDGQLSHNLQQRIKQMNQIYHR